MIAAGSVGQICITEIFTTEAPQKIAREKITTIVKKRKVDLECWAFNPEWENYFFIECFGLAQ